jgi:hypothetical protein
MKNFQIALIFLLISLQPAWAEFKLIAESDSRSYFIDSDSVTKDGNFRLVWTITNLSTRGKNGELSWKNRTEYDCYEERWRARISNEHTEVMGQGAVVRTLSKKSDFWLQVRPDGKENFHVKVLKIVCAK